MRVGSGEAAGFGWGARGLWRGRRALPALGALMLLNVADALFTRGYLMAGLATEANPLMRAAWNVSPAVFLVSKLVLVTAGALLLWRHRRHAFAGAALLAALAVYATVVGYHVAFLGTRVLMGGAAVP